MTVKEFQRRGYVSAPTALESAPILSRAVGGGVRVWIKRDDMLPGAAGGNKTRKLDYLLAEALAANHNAVITCGAPQSNHCRLTLAWCVKEGLECHLVIEERIPGSYDRDGSGNLLLFKLLGAKSVTVVPGGSDMALAMEKIAGTLRGKGLSPFIIPVGGSTALGSLGYVAFAQELKQQLIREGLDPDAIVVASGSGGTQAGIVAGLRMLGMATPVYGINVGKSRDEQSAIVAGIARELWDMLAIAAPLAKEDILCDDGYFAPGYGLPSPAMIEAVKLFASTEAVLLDPTYTGKAAAGLLDYIKKGMFREKANILFVHTGGAPALYAYPHIFK